jgi:tetratricopeptide (TPR) repeat protein
MQFVWSFALRWPPAKPYDLRMSDDGTSPSDDAGAGERYRFLELLGQGGMAVVHRVLDQATGRQVALKRLTVSVHGATRAGALFEREYLTLAQLAHPRIVAVYDYGIDAQGPYYTMELLDGGDLQGLSPVPWRRACELAHDVCSALALIHSRRFVYRDLSPRNVRCTSDGLAKLIDFGALSPMGPTRELVGTYPFMPPEALNQQPLDARSDLYSLGATFYFALTQRHAYPARDVAQLRDLWRSRPRAPGELGAGSPQALDKLVLELMHLDPEARPANIAEVMSRLSAIAGLRSSEQQLVSQAYLSHPSLVGRAAALTQARALVLRAQRARGAALLIQGASGLGRSRFLDATVLEAKLAGLVVLRCDASDAAVGAYGSVRALARQLFEAAGVAARVSAEAALPLLGHAIPDLVAQRPDVVLASAEDPLQLQRRVQQAVRQWLLDVTLSRRLLIAIDDLPRIDESSAACIALLAQEIAEVPIVIAASADRAESGASAVRGALELFATASFVIELMPLSLEETEELLGSVFGAVPNLHPLARYVHGVTAGNPRDTMRLAQHLVSERWIVYQAGAWSLPAQLDAAMGLPASMSDALAVRVARLSDDARAIALAFALEPKQAFGFDECALLVAHAASAQPVNLMQALDELITSELVRYAGERYALTQQLWAGPLVGTATDRQVRDVHLRLAEVYARRAEGFRTAQHLLKGGERARGLDVLIAHAASSERETDTSVRAFVALLQSLPPDWLSTYALGLQLCGELGRPVRQHDALLSRVGGLVAHSVSEGDGYVYIAMRIARLEKESGLERFAAQPDGLDHGTKLKNALTEATIRFHQMPEHERVFEPKEAIAQLTKSVLTALGTILFSCDQRAWQRLPSLAPLVPLAAPLAVVQQLSDGLGARLVGRSEDAIAIYERLLVKLAAPDRAGLTPSHHNSTQHRIVLGLGLLEAAMGRTACLERAERLEGDAFYAPQALLVRHVYHVWQGDVREAARVQQQIEIARIESAGQYGFEGPHLLSEVAAYALADDLTRVASATQMVEERARVHRAWVPVAHYGRAEYQRIRGDYEAALVELERALALIDEGRHQVWPYIAGAHLRTLVELGRLASARTHAEAYLQTSAAIGLGYMRNFLLMPLALATARAGEHAEATALAQRIIDECFALGLTGLNLALAYETRAKVALAAGDQAGFAEFAALCAEQVRSGEKRLLGAKHGRSESRSDPKVQSDDLSVLSVVHSILEMCETGAQRAHAGIEQLIRNSGAIGGLLYTYTGSGLVFAASAGEMARDDGTDEFAAAYFARELGESDATVAFSQPPSAPSQRESMPGERSVPVLLSHQTEQGHAITGITLLRTEPGAQFTYPSRIAGTISRLIAEEGDAEIAYA